MQLLFATTNKNKIAEIKAALSDNFRLLSLEEVGLADAEVEEPYLTLAENAIHKATCYEQLSGIDCFSEDTGLEADVLNGAPGVLSARYAGMPANSNKNIEKLLREMEGKNNRSARFRTVIALRMGGETHAFEGICEGTILFSKQGEAGFGYDPVFKPEGADSSFAEMTTHEKNQYSHRKKALIKLIQFLESNR
ncbi:MAG: RdgB/HAM1 family non-canonical purine NTP pyrophosphatase [Bacteroidetes bacterium]|nr:RdgB/HAM1 family non-canonical purine NTP pyrophosphatase [Bacteroidota bacterium]